MKRYCKNCFYPLSNKAKFCAHCGQKDSDGKVRMSTMLRKLWDSTFHLESKFLRSCWQLFIPGKVTTEFFKGKQDRYPHPLRMFAIVMFMFLFMLNSMLNNRQKHNPNKPLSLTRTVKMENGSDSIDRAEMSMYERMKYQALLSDMRQDYENLPEAWRTTASRKAVDSLLRKNNLRNSLDEPGLLDSLQTDADSINIGVLGDIQLEVATADLVRYEPDEVIRMYNISDWKMQLMLRQTIKSYKNPDGFIHSYIGSLTWTILALVALMSAVLALLYRRQKRYYVEHFIFLLHFHTGMMLALLFTTIGIHFDFWRAGMLGWVYIACSIFMYFALRKYYGQGGGKTFLKWLIFGILYFIGFALLFTLGTIIVFAVY